MTRKAEFNAEEWSTVVDGPLHAGMRVISADRGGSLRESLAMSRAYQLDEISTALGTPPVG